MKKKLNALLSMLVIALMLTAAVGCGKSSDASADASAETMDSADVSDSSDSAVSADSASSIDSAASASSAGSTDTADATSSADSDLLSGLHHAEITVRDYGTISLELDADTAPITVTNFVKLAKAGFYDGLTFHRIISGFMIQGGDPKGNGTGGSDETIKGEFSANGVENSISHERGVISMARSQDYDSASSQFFIMHADAAYLDGQYAAFGHVTEGMEVVDQICQDTPVQDNNGTVAKANQPVIESITITD